MEFSQDTLLFCEVLETEGARLLHVVDEDGETIHCYAGPVSGYAQICVSEEFIYNRTAQRILVDLGMSSLIERMYWGPPN